MSDNQTPGLLYYTQASFCGPAVRTETTGLCSCPGFVPSDCIRVYFSSYMASGTATTKTVTTVSSNTARLVITETNAESIAVAEVNTRKVVTTLRRDTYNNAQFGARQDAAACNVEGEGWKIVISGYNQMGYATNPSIDYFSEETNYVLRVNDILTLYGKDGTGKAIPYTLTSSGSGADGAAQTIPGYLSTFRTILDATWAVGIRVMQGIGKEAAVRVWCGEEEDDYGIGPPSLEAWKDVRQVFDGWPAETEQDKRTSPIGFA